MVSLVVLSASVLASCSGDGGGEEPPKPTAVRASACGYFVNVGLFGGPQTLRGCKQAANVSGGNTSASPYVELPAGGSATPISANDADGAAGVYGPATIFGGRWPCEKPGQDTDLPLDGIPGNCTATAPPSGPITTSVQGTLDGTVIATADIGLHASPVEAGCYSGYGPKCVSYGGLGPFPVEADSVHVECTASATETTGSVTFKNGTHATSTDAEGEPKDMERIPDNPPPNYTRSGVITNVGDVFTAVYNEQIINDDGSLTVNGVHMYLFGPVAVGEMVKGQATCGRIPSSVPKDGQPPSCGTLVVAPVSPEVQTPKTPLTELVGVFDARGLQSIENVKVTNGEVEIGNPSGLPYLHFKPGQTGPVPVTATRTPEAEAADLKMEWSFDAIDRAGNSVHCPIDRAPTAAETGIGTTTSRAPTATSAPVGAPTTAPAGVPTTTRPGGAATTTRPSTTGSGATTTASTTTTRPA